MRLQKIPKKHSTVLYSVLMPICMVTLMSGYMTAMHTGLNGDFLSRWVQNYWMAILVAVPSAQIMSRIVRRLVAKLTSD